MGVKTDTNQSWQHDVDDLSTKLNRANALLFKMRKYVMLVLKYSDQSISLFLTPIYPTTVLPGLRIVALFNEL